MTHQLERKIGQVRRRARWLLVLYAFGFTFGVLALFVLVLGTADYWIRFRDPGIRLFSSLAVAAAFGWSVYRFWFLAFRSGWSDGRIAARIEQYFPQLRHRLTSALEFAKTPDADPAAGSADLRRALVETTTAIGEPLDFSRGPLDWSPAWRALQFGGVLLLAVATFAFVAPESTRTALVRLARPLGNDDWPRYYNLAFRSPPTRLAVGQPFEVELMRDAEHRVPDSVRIFYGYGQSPAPDDTESEQMTFLAGTMTARKDRVTRPFWYRAEGGDDTSMEWIRLEVVEPPRVESLELSLHPPAYSALPVSSSENNIHALRGTRVQVEGSSTKKLRKASIRLENGGEVNLPLSADGYGFSLAVEAQAPFVIEQSGSYAIALDDEKGLVGGLDARYEIQAIADQAPTVTIEQPLGNVFITPSGQVPLKIVAKDDLAIASMTLRYSRSGSDEVEDASVTLYEGPTSASGRTNPFVSAAQSGSGESRAVEHRWSIAELGLKPGAQMTFWATATDYLPQTGKSTPRKISIITPAELEERLAQRQSLVFGELQRVLKLQQDTRAQTKGLEIQLDQVGTLNKQDLDHAQSAELNQRQVARSLTSPDEGVRAQVTEFLNDLDNNRIDSPDIERHMKSLLSEIERLDAEHLTPVERDLTGLIKAAQAKLPQDPADDAKQKADPAVQTALKRAAGHQDQVIDSLEHVLTELGQWESYRRFARGVAQMQRDQEQTSAATKELAQKTIGREFKDLDTQQQADLKKISAQQSELSRRLERLQQQMAETSGELRQADPLSSATIEDGLHQAQKQAISAQMRQSAERVERNQLGQAVEQQSKIARDLDELAGILSSRKEQELARLVKQLREAERDLERLHSEQGGLRKRARELAQEPDEEAKKTQLERLARKQKQLEEETARLARRLERLQAERAGSQGARAADKMRQAQAAGEQGDGDTAGDQAAAAEKDLEEAQQKLAERRKQAEQDLAHEQMARLDDSLKSLHERQQKLVHETRRLENLRAESGRFSRAQLGTLHDLSRQQQSMEGETSGIAEKLEAAEVIHLALTGAAKQMSRAAELLTQRQTGTATQTSQEAAHDRLARLLAALAQDKKPPQPGGNEQQEGEGEQAGGQTRADGNEVLTQLKLLKLLQEDLNARFTELTPQSPDNQSRASELAELALEQGNLAELVFKLAEPPADHPEDSPEQLPDVRDSPPALDPADVPAADEEDAK